MRVADLIVKALEAQSISRVYCVPGESYLALLDALYESPIKTIVCRHESGAGFMAVAEAKMTGRPAVFMVSRGPGATNGSIAVHVAQQDAVPVIVLIGQVSREERGRGAFQEVDYTHFFGEMAKGVFELTDAVEGCRDHGARLPSRGARRAGTGGDRAAGGFARGRERTQASRPLPYRAAEALATADGGAAERSSTVRNGRC